jgi:hypothetical protein
LESEHGEQTLDVRHIFEEGQGRDERGGNFNAGDSETVGLCEDFAYHASLLNAGEALVKALKFERELPVVDAHEMQDGGV